jgi:hypothetical protein
MEIPQDISKIKNEEVKSVIVNLIDTHLQQRKGVEKLKDFIRWHMIAFEAGIHFDYPTGFPFRQAVKEYPLVTLLFTADFEASNIFNT